MCDQHDLVLEVLRRLHSSGVLRHLILIGSWCLPLYRQLLGGSDPLPAIRTRDMDFLIPDPSGIPDIHDVPSLLRDIGFLAVFRGQHGLLRLEHPDLMIEFLVPERGRGSDRPLSVPQLKLNAERLRFLALLENGAVEVPVSGFPVTIPHPANFALQKLLISSRRGDPDKTQKDRDAAIAILHALLRKSDSGGMVRVFETLPSKWRESILQVLRKSGEHRLVDLLTRRPGKVS